MNILDAQLLAFGNYLFDKYQLVDERGHDVSVTDADLDHFKVKHVEALTNREAFRHTVPQVKELHIYRGIRQKQEPEQIES